MKKEFCRVLGFLLAFIMLIGVFPVMHVSADKAVIAASDMEVTLSSNATHFYGLKNLNAETGVYSFTGEKSSWNVNEDNSLITISLNAQPANKYYVIGISVKAANPSKSDNIKFTVDGKSSYLSVDFKNTASGIDYILVDASSVISNSASVVNSIGILPFECLKNVGSAYSADIESVAYFTSLSEAYGYIAEKTPEVPMDERAKLTGRHTVFSNTYETTILTDNSTFLSAETLYSHKNFGTNGMTRSLIEKNGETYLKLSTPAGTYSNNNHAFSLACEALDFNVIDNRYFKIVYFADYDKGMDISVNPYASPSVNGVETWLSGASNPSANSSGNEITYVLDLTKLNAKVPSGLTNDYTNFNLIIKPLGSGNKTTNVETNIYIKYMGFFATEAEAYAFEPSTKAVADSGKYNTDSLIDDVIALDADYLDINVPCDKLTSELDFVFSKSFIAYYVQNNCKFGVNVITDGMKISLPSEFIYEISDFGTDVVLKRQKDGDTYKLDLLDTFDSALNVTSHVRVLLDLNAKPGSVIKTSGAVLPTSGDIIGRPAANVTLPVEISYGEGRNIKFSDTENHWATYYIDFTVARSLFNGISDVEFAPNSSITRAMAAKVLSSLYGNYTLENSHTYTDVNPDAWYSDAVSWAYEYGIAEAGITKFRPDEAITREELAGFIFNFAKLFGYDTAAKKAGFSDFAQIENKEAVNYCAAKGIINGYPDGSFRPSMTSTRAEAAAMLSRFIKVMLMVNDIDISDYQNIDFDENNIVLTFAAMSDIHITSKSTGDGCYKAYKSAMDTAYDLAVTGDVDLVFAAGDLTQNLAYDPTVDANGDGVIDQADHKNLFEIEAFKSFTDMVLRDDTYLVFTTGNHDRSPKFDYEDYFYNAFTSTEEDINRYYRFDVKEDSEYDKGNRHAVVNGYHFLSVGMYQDYEAYLKPLLDEITAAEPYKPVFVQYHFPASETVYSAYQVSSSPEASLKKLLDNYPQVVFFAGHTHAALENPRSIWQGTFTALDTASVRALDDNGLIHFESIKIPVNATHSEVYNYASEATLVEVDANNNIRFRAYNSYRGDIVNEFVIAGPNKNNTHLLTYTDEREYLSKAPVFAKNANFTLTKLAQNNIGVYFDAAEHENVVWYYSIEFKAEGYDTEKFYFFSRFYEPTGVPSAIDCTLYTNDYYVSTNDNHAGRGHKLTEGVTYTATLTAYDAWDHASEVLTTEYTA